MDIASLLSGLFSSSGGGQGGAGYVEQPPNYAELAQIFQNAGAQAQGNHWLANVARGLGGFGGGYYGMKAGEQEQANQAELAELMAKSMAGEPLSEQETLRVLQLGGKPSSGGASGKLRQVYNPETGRTEYKVAEAGDVAGFSNYGIDAAILNATGGGANPREVGKKQTARRVDDAGADGVAGTPDEVANSIADAVSTDPATAPARARPNAPQIPSTVDRQAAPAASAAANAAPRPPTEAPDLGAPAPVSTNRPADADATQAPGAGTLAVQAPQPSEDGGGILASIGDAVGDLFGSPESADVPVDANGVPDPAQMEPGRVYTINGQRVRLKADGSGFEMVN